MALVQPKAVLRGVLAADARAELGYSVFFQQAAGLQVDAVHGAQPASAAKSSIVWFSGAPEGAFHGLDRQVRAGC